MSDLTSQDKILSVLSRAYLPLTAREISQIAELNINTTRTIIPQMVNRGEIEPINQGPGTKNLYMYKKIEDEGTIEILVIGKWMKRNLEREENFETDNEFKFSLFQCVGLINFYDLRKICGIHRYTSPDKINEIGMGVQRQRHDKWVEELKEGLKSSKAEMWSTAIIYFDLNRIEYTKLRDYNGQEIGVIIITYDGHVYDAEKPGWILDGQQRMWALENIAIASEDPDSLKLVGPVTIAIGEFYNKDTGIKLNFIRRTFSHANKTQNLPKNFRKDLIGTLDDYSQETMTKKDKKDALISSLIRYLNTDKDSPFNGIIDMKNRGLPRIQGELISWGAMNYIIQEILEYEAFNKEDLPIPEIDSRYKFNLELIKDYFNAIKYIYSSEWEQLVQNSRLRSRLVLSSFSMLIGKILHISIALSSDRNTRFKEIVRENLKISEDERVSFNVNSPLLLNLKNNQADIKTLTENLIKIYTQNSQYNPEELIIGKVYDEWRKLLEH
ncbi:MAG: hypothetical protein CEE43_06020 [Promethearchaeota archaeon Loki_b32]|nr:MAG: hypothetical protein CEE43_06020 [Candidatus Lokiarchaeota archaeon Loki_b32]